MAEVEDFPLLQIEQTMAAAIEEGHICFQKFTCAGCGSRQMMDVPNVLYTSGHCEECGHTSDLLDQGCNFLMAMVLPVESPGE